MLKYFDCNKLIILKTNSFNYVIKGILFQYNNEKTLYSIIFYHKNLIFIKYNYKFIMKLLIIIKYLKY